MILANYQIITIKNNDLLQISELLNHDINLRRPIAFKLTDMTLDDQREVIGIIENWFDTEKVSWKFPYPTYFISDIGASLGQIPIVKTHKDLPRLFQFKESRLHVRETQLLEKNYLIQQQIKNFNSDETDGLIKKYADGHKTLRRLQFESEYCILLMKKLIGD
jgi:hypothetical protein